MSVRRGFSDRRDATCTLEDTLAFYNSLRFGRLLLFLLRLRVFGCRQ